MPGTNDEPTMGEVIRRLDAIALQLTEVVREIKDDRAENAKTFVRQDVYMAQRQSDAAVVADLHGEVRAVKAARDKDVETQRTRNLTLAVLAITTIVSIALGIANILAR